MNFFARVSFLRANLAKLNVFPQLTASFIRSISVSDVPRCEHRENPEEGESKIEEPIDPAIDRTKIIPVETSVRYLKSTAYQTTYGDQPVWVQYRRNFKGQFAPLKTRKTCIRAGKISTGNPCPICRDEYLVLDHNNVDLLKQFISQHTGEVRSIRF
jgi:small subunit ribosomal protein S18b, mitochondrial